jgi:hypothetical protein
LPGALCGVVVERALDDSSALLASKLHGSVAAEGIEDYDVIRPSNRLETGADVDLFIEREYQDRYGHGLCALGQVDGYFAAATGV